MVWPSFSLRVVQKLEFLVLGNSEGEFLDPLHMAVPEHLHEVSGTNIPRKIIPGTFLDLNTKSTFPYHGVIP